jgi:sugar phosphate isomerase/epimerase
MPLKLPASSKMRLGISSWTYPWSIGMDGFPSSRHPIRLADLLTRASLLQVQVVQVADNLPLHLLDEGELRDACAQAAELGLTIEVGTRGVDPARLRQYLKIALSLKARMLRTLLDPPSSQLSLKQAEASLRKVLPEFEAHGVTLGLENYEAHSCSALAELVRRVGSHHLGVCLDTVNSLGALEPPKYVVETLAPLTVNLHIKDFVIERVPQRTGFLVTGAQAGNGQLDIPWVLRQMPAARDMSVILEQWPPLESSVEDAVAREQEWATHGIEYLRTCGCN